MGIPSIKGLIIAQHKLANPLSEKDKYIFWIMNNAHTVGNGDKRRECAYLERMALRIQLETKQGLIDMLKIWTSNAFVNANYHLKPSDIWPVVRLIKKGLSLHMKFGCIMD